MIKIYEKKPWIQKIWQHVIIEIGKRYFSSQQNTKLPCILNKANTPFKRKMKIIIAIFYVMN